MAANTTTTFNSTMKPAEDDPAEQQEDGGDDESIEVSLTCRIFQTKQPFLEEMKGCVNMETPRTPGTKLIKGTQVWVDTPDGPSQKFAFDYSFNQCPNAHKAVAMDGGSYAERLDGGNFSTQEDVFEKVGARLLRQAQQGRNVCALAYGQTGSGKTFTMIGKRAEHAGETAIPGVIPRMVDALFGQIEAHKAKNKHNSGKIILQCVEVYIKDLHDLFVPQKEWPAHGIKPLFSKHGYINPGKEVVVHDVPQLMELMDRADNNRSTGSTPGNDRSSRAHTIYTITLAQKEFLGLDAAGKPEEETTKSVMTLVDLAGTEDPSRLDRSDPEYKEKFRQGTAINESLRILAGCIRKLSELAPGKNADKITLFNDQKLTTMLKYPLTSSKTSVIGACSPALKNWRESLNTLGFLKTCKKVIVRARANKTKNVAAELEAELAAVKATMDDKVAELTRQLEAERMNRTGGMDNDEVRKLVVELEEEKRLREEQEAHWAAKLAESKETPEQQAAHEAALKKKFDEQWRKALSAQGMCLEDWSTITVPFITNLSSEPSLCGAMTFKIAQQNKKYVVGSKGGKGVETDIKISTFGVIPAHVTLEWTSEEDVFAAGGGGGGRGSGGSGGLSAPKKPAPGPFGDMATTGMQLAPTAASGLFGGGSPVPARQYLYLTVGADAFVLVNGVPIAAGEKVQLRHWDLIFLGRSTNAVFRVQFPGQEMYRRARRNVHANAAAATAAAASGLLLGAESSAPSFVGESGLRRADSLSNLFRRRNDPGAPGWSTAVSLFAHFEEKAKEHEHRITTKDAALDALIMTYEKKTYQCTRAAASLLGDTLEGSDCFNKFVSFEEILISDPLAAKQKLSIRARLPFGNYIWSLDKFDDAYVRIMQLYDEWARRDDDEDAPFPLDDPSPERNPFVDNEPQLLGFGRIFLESLGNMMEIDKKSLPLVELHSGEVIGFLSFRLDPLDSRGRPGPWEEEEDLEFDPFCDGPEDLLDTTIQYRVSIASLTFSFDGEKASLPPPRDVHVRFLFNPRDDADSWVSTDQQKDAAAAAAAAAEGTQKKKSDSVAPASPVANINFQKDFSLKVTPAVVQHLHSGAMVVEAWGLLNFGTGSKPTAAPALPEGWKKVSVAAFRSPQGHLHLLRPAADGTPSDEPFQRKKEEGEADDTMAQEN